MAVNIASDIARYFIHISKPGTSENITNLKLQKILYYAQGLYLKKHRLPLFNERIEAWAHGPVVPDVYREFKQFKYNEIKKTEKNPNFNNLSAEDRDFLDSVWERFKSFSGKELEEMTHQHKPWKDKRDGLPEFVSTNDEMTVKEICEWFTTNGSI
ncbi:DUF4065 domain-containing protein [Bacillus licheniformis]|uniref:Panacea domain-containing protein n=1 Tax=Bacillus licheniformis TaxID=1402 RepID=UPI00227FA73F|nr:type II toxin-antitoxin system antitoxin SocA domain-containing protein [Bacillus licheniformis]MCY9349847.1 DUF4065 domain-containing protein [Bacillus licheniformis]